MDKIRTFWKNQSKISNHVQIFFLNADIVGTRSAQAFGGALSRSYLGFAAAAEGWQAAAALHSYHIEFFSHS